MADATRGQVIGPVLHFHGTHGGRAHFAVSTAWRGGGEPGPIVAAGAEVAATPAGELGDLTFWTHRFSAGLGETSGYSHGGRHHDLRLPAPGDALRVAFASCNGGEDEAKAASVPNGRNAMWADLLACHAADPFHILVMGGDQIYADALWDLPTLKRWGALGRRARIEAPFTQEMAQEAEAFYVRCYSDVWSQPEIADALATIPAIMMWDDHDIFDGWGSRADDLQASPVFAGLYEIARRAFALFQLGADADDLPPGFGDRGGRHFGFAADYGAARIVVPDLRSERTRANVLGEDGTRFLTDAIGNGADRPPRVLLVSTVPMVNADLSAVERPLTLLMRWKDIFQDDLRDQWMSYAHKTEWGGLMRKLLAAAEGGSGVSVLSGEIHLAGYGTAEANGAVVEQFIASGIAHPPPPELFGRVLGLFARRPWEREGITLRMEPITADGRSYVAERNWLEIDVAANGHTRGRIHTEDSGEIVPTHGHAGG